MVTKKIFDSDNIEIKPGDIIEAVSEDPNNPLTWKWHVAYLEDGEIVIRDGISFNRNMYDLYDRFYTRGPLKDNLDRFTQEELDFWFKSYENDCGQGEYWMPLPEPPKEEPSK